MGCPKAVANHVLPRAPLSDRHGRSLNIRRRARIRLQKGNACGELAGGFEGRRRACAGVPVPLAAEPALAGAFRSIRVLVECAREACVRFSRELRRPRLTSWQSTGNPVSLQSHEEGTMHLCCCSAHLASTRCVPMYYVGRGLSAARNSLTTRPPAGLLFARGSCDISSGVMFGNASLRGVCAASHLRPG